MITMEEQIVNILSNLGVAGAVLIVFYLLFTNELRHLRVSIERLNENISEINKTLYALQVLIQNIEKERKKG